MSLCFDIRNYEIYTIKWYGDSPEHWLVQGLPITLTGAQNPQDTGMDIARSTDVEILQNSDWCGDSPEHWMVWRFPRTLSSVGIVHNTLTGAEIPQDTGMEIPQDTD